MIRVLHAEDDQQLADMVRLLFESDGTPWTIEDEIVSAMECHVDAVTSTPDITVRVVRARQPWSLPAEHQRSAMVPEAVLTVNMPEMLLRQMTGVHLVNSLARSWRSGHESLADEMRIAVTGYINERAYYMDAASQQYFSELWPILCGQK